MIIKQVLEEKKLPPLPRTLKKREADFGVLFRKWLADNDITTNAAYELKQTPGYSIPFGVLGNTQIAYLRAAKSKRGTLMRLDGTKGEPDYVALSNALSCVVIKFRGSFHIIDIDAFLWEKDTSKRKSLTAGRAKAISIYDHTL